MKANVSKMTASLNELQQKAMMDEINKQTADNLKNMERNIDILIAYGLRKHCGFGRKRIVRFIKDIDKGLRDLEEWYAMSERDQIFLAERELKKEGLDIDIIREEAGIDI